MNYVVHRQILLLKHDRDSEVFGGMTRDVICIVPGSVVGCCGACL